MNNEEKHTIAGLICDKHSSGYRKKKVQVNTLNYLNKNIIFKYI